MLAEKLQLANNIDQWISLNQKFSYQKIKTIQFFFKQWGLELPYDIKELKSALIGVILMG